MESAFERPGPPSPNTRSRTRLAGMVATSDAPRARTCFASTFVNAEIEKVVLLVALRRRQVER